MLHNESGWMFWKKLWMFISNFVANSNVNQLSNSSQSLNIARHPRRIGGGEALDQFQLKEERVLTFAFKSI